jgi:starch phosphorylase
VKKDKKEQFAAYALWYVVSSFCSIQFSVRDRLIERWKDTELYFDNQDVKKVFYLSLEFLLGRSLQNAVEALNLSENFSRSFTNLGMDMENVFEQVRYNGLSDSRANRRQTQG